jgi:hypothetical protein
MYGGSLAGIWWLISRYMVAHWLGHGGLLADICVSEHMGWVRSVVPMSVYFGFGKPQGVGISGRGQDGRVREMRGSVYEQPKEEVDGSCHS